MNKPWPQDIRYRKYSDEKYSFAYPDKARYARFKRSNGSSSLKLTFIQGDHTIRVSLDQILTPLPVADLARQRFAATKDAPENIAPHEIDLAKNAAWYMRRVFQEGGRGIYLIESVFFQVGNQVFCLEYFADMDVHAADRWVFEVILQSIDFNTAQ